MLNMNVVVVSVDPPEQHQHRMYPMKTTAVANQESEPNYLSSACISISIAPPDGFTRVVNLSILIDTS